MGKHQSKHACKRRENPEGDSFVVNAFLRRGMEECERYSATDHKPKNMQGFPNGELKERQFTDQHCPLEVVLPPEKAEGCESYLQYLHPEDGVQEIHRDSSKAPGKKISLDDLECDVSVEDDNRQEWIFTLYDFDNSGKVTKDDMSSLMHTIYDVVDASVNHSCHNKSKTLRVKLSVTPEPRCNRKETATDRHHQEEGRAADKRLSSYVGSVLYSNAGLSKGQAMRRRPRRVSITVWTRTQRGGITTWTWLVLRTTPPDLRVSPLTSPHRRFMSGTPRARVARAPKNQKPKSLTSDARRSSAITTTLQSLEARAHTSRMSNLPKEPTGEVEGTTGSAEAANPLNVTATTRLCRARRTVAARRDTAVRMCTTCHTKPVHPATTSTLCNTATANASGRRAREATSPSKSPLRLSPTPTPTPTSSSSRLSTLCCRTWRESRRLALRGARGLWFLWFSATSTTTTTNTTTTTTTTITIRHDRLQWAVTETVQDQPHPTDHTSVKDLTPAHGERPAHCAGSFYSSLTDIFSD
uniref:Protein naked cuticle homolog n=1 Tax=Gasterosteus aculeatus aculeatus TaxID=481459 RepID=G3P126_GASAC